MVELKDIEYLAHQQMWSSEEISKTLDYLNTHEDELILFKNELDKIYSKFKDYCGDHEAILSAVNSNSIEMFRRFDSAVLENYITDFENIILKRKKY